jgi:hypothetical protein
MAEQLRGQFEKFVDSTACSAILMKLAANGLEHVFEKFIACQGGYFEKE